MNMIKQSKLSIDQLCPDQRILYCCFYSADLREQQSFLPQEEGYLTWYIQSVDRKQHNQ
ncbi:hypothetical protein BHE74_00012441 [Ensete ventricosum]|nr:hypothetical protein GW17_00055829 [Ensete ventricosum]RWW79293.1 hypothetical protein BHE74_00012441 [Ensete ventricosum]RZR95251.1 hypothetical protein BHM03_00024075 [Ensete ventricosum]